MKFRKSLILAFTLAAACTLGTVDAAEAQTAMAPAATVEQSAYVNAETGRVEMNTETIAALVQGMGVQEVFPNAGKAFSSGVINETGQHFGLEFDVEGNDVKLSKIYNLDNRYGMNQFKIKLNRATRANMNRAQQPFDVNAMTVSYSPDDTIGSVAMDITGDGGGNDRVASKHMRQSSRQQHQGSRHVEQDSRHVESWGSDWGFNDSRHWDQDSRHDRQSSRHKTQDPSG